MDMVTFLQLRGVEVVKSGGPRRDKHLTEGWVQMPCPICGGNKLWLGYNLNTGHFNCYSHGYSSRYDLFRAWFPEENVKELLEQIDGVITRPSVNNDQQFIHEYRPPQFLNPLDSSYLHCEYVRNRGLDPVVLAYKWGVMAINEDPNEWKYSNRLFFPVCNVNNQPVSWLTRTITSNTNYRYLTAPKDRELAPIKSFLYGEQFVSPFDTVIVTEGVFDALRVGTNAVATLGKKITNVQFNKIAQYQRRIICFDSERDTQEQARELAYKLQAFPGITDVVELDAPDPSTASDKEITSLLKYAELV